MRKCFKEVRISGHTFVTGEENGGKVETDDDPFEVKVYNEDESVIHKITIVKKRIHFLPDSSVNYYFGLPTFSDDDRQLFFDLSNDEKKVAESIRNLKSRIHFILMLGYFKAKTILFDLQSESVNHDDIHYIAGLYDQKVKALFVL